MIKDIEVTLYDVFGYLYPGAVLLIAFAVAAWAVFFPTVKPVVPSVGLQGWILIVFVSYLLGHMTQAIGYCLKRVYPLVQELDADQRKYTPDALVDAAYDRAFGITGVPREQLTWEALGRLCDTTIAQCGRVADRDVYVYRQGFYRGTSVSFFALGLSLLVIELKLFFGRLSLDNIGAPCRPWWVVVGTALVLSVVAGLLFRARFRHFTLWVFVRLLRFMDSWFCIGRDCSRTKRRAGRMLELVVWDVRHESAAYIRAPGEQHMPVDAGSGSYGQAGCQPPPTPQEVLWRGTT